MLDRTEMRKILMQSIVDNRDLSTLDKGVLKNIEWVDEDYVILRYAE